MTTTACLTLGVLGFALAAPLLYAVKTLLGMQHKKVYPLLRTSVSQDGARPLVYPTPIEQKGD